MEYEDDELGNDNLDDEINDDGTAEGGDEPETTPTPVDESQVLAYLKAQGLTYKNIEDIKNQGLSVKGMTKKINELNERNKVISGHPKFAQFLQEAYAGVKPEDSKTELPEPLQSLPPEKMQAYKKVFSHFMSPELERLEKKIEMSVRDKLYEIKYPNRDEYEAQVVEFLKERGITNPSDRTIDWAYKEVTKQSESKEKDNGDYSDSRDRPELKKKVSQIGIVPKKGNRSASKITAPEGSEEYWKQKLEAENEEE